MLKKRKSVVILNRNELWVKVENTNLPDLFIDYVFIIRKVEIRNSIQYEKVFFILILNSSNSDFIHENQNSPSRFLIYVNRVKRLILIKIFPWVGFRSILKWIKNFGYDFIISGILNDLDFLEFWEIVLIRFVVKLIRTFLQL